MLLSLVGCVEEDDTLSLVLWLEEEGMNKNKKYNNNMPSAVEAPHESGVYFALRGSRIGPLPELLMVNF